MKPVIDANILISALLSEGRTRKLILESNYELYSPDYLESEVEKHRKELIEKSGLKESEFKTLITILLDEIEIIPNEDYRMELDKANQAMKDVDIKDVPFLACALAKNSKIWSDDDHFRKQNPVPHLTTARIIEMEE